MYHELSVVNNFVEDAPTNRVVGVLLYGLLYVTAPTVGTVAVIPLCGVWVAVICVYVSICEDVGTKSVHVVTSEAPSPTMLWA